MEKELNHFLGIPITMFTGCEVRGVVVRSQVSFRPTYLVIPKVIAELEPILKMRGYFSEHPGEVDEIIENGCDQAQHFAQETMSLVREAMKI